MLNFGEVMAVSCKSIAGNGSCPFALSDGSKQLRNIGCAEFIKFFARHQRFSLVHELSNGFRGIAKGSSNCK
jgi:hypothetical protein